MNTYRVIHHKEDQLYYADKIDVVDGNLVFYELSENVVVKETYTYYVISSIARGQWTKVLKVKKEQE